MKVLEFAFDTGADNVYLPHMYAGNTVCYTGTHDNMPLKQWFAETDAETVAFAMDYMAQPQNPVWGMIRLCLSSVSDLAVVQMQDYLELDGQARMNFPGTRTGNNWTWRANTGFADDLLAKKIRHLTQVYGRI